MMGYACEEEKVRSRGGLLGDEDGLAGRFIICAALPRRLANPTL